MGLLCSLPSLLTRQESTGFVPYPHSVTRSPGGLAVELAMTIPERKPGISWEVDSLYHHCLLCSEMPGYHPVSIYDVTMGTKMQTGAWGTLSLVGCHLRLVLGDSRLGSSVVFLKTTLPCSSLVNRRPSSHVLGLRKKSHLVATLYWRGSRALSIG